MASAAKKKQGKKKDLKKINSETASKLRIAVAATLAVGVGFYFAHDTLSSKKNEMKDAHSQALASLEHSQHNLKLLYDQINEYKKRGRDYNSILEQGLVGDVEKASLSDALVKFMGVFAVPEQYSINIKKDVVITRKGKLKELAGLKLKKKSIFSYTPVEVNATYLTDDAPFRMSAYIGNEISKYHLIDKCGFTLSRVRSDKTGGALQTRVITRCTYNYIHATPRKIAALAKK